MFNPGFRNKKVLFGRDSQKDFPECGFVRGGQGVRYGILEFERLGKTPKRDLFLGRRAKTRSAETCYFVVEWEGSPGKRAPLFGPEKPKATRCYCLEWAGVVGEKGTVLGLLPLCWRGRGAKRYHLWAPLAKCKKEMRFGTQRLDVVYISSRFIL